MQLLFALLTITIGLEGIHGQLQWNLTIAFKEQEAICKMNKSVTSFNVTQYNKCIPYKALEVVRITSVNDDGTAGSTGPGLTLPSGKDIAGTCTGWNGNKECFKKLVSEVKKCGQSKFTTLTILHGAFMDSMCKDNGGTLMSYLNNSKNCVETQWTGIVMKTAECWDKEKTATKVLNCTDQALTTLCTNDPKIHATLTQAMTFTQKYEKSSASYSRHEPLFAIIPLIAIFQLI